MVAIGLSAKSQSRRVTVSLEFPSPQWGEGLGEGGSVEGGFRPETSRKDEEGASLFVIPASFWRVSIFRFPKRDSCQKQAGMTRKISGYFVLSL